MTSRDAPAERERTRSRSGHRDHSAERRSRRRDGESDKHRRRRDRHRRDTLSDVAEPPISGDPPLMGNALGFHPPSLRPGQGLYSSVAPPVSTPPGPSTSRAGGVPSSRPPTSHGMAPPIAATTSNPGSSYREAPQYNGPYQRREEPISRPSSTPNGHVLSSWVAPDLSNPSLNSLGLSAAGQGGPNSQTIRASSAAMPLTTRDSVSSWGTAESAPYQGDLFSTLHPLGSAPADSGLPPGDLLPRPDGQLLGVVRAHFYLLATYAHSLARAALDQLPHHNHSVHKSPYRRQTTVVLRTPRWTIARTPVTRTTLVRNRNRLLPPTATPPSRHQHHRFSRLTIGDFLMLPCHHRQFSHSLPRGHGQLPQL